MKTATALLIALGFLVPALASASATITEVTLNGGSFVSVDPGANITVEVTATLTDSTKWKGTNWGINSGSFTTTCANTKNAKEGTRNNETGVFTETFIIKAPSQPGLYNADFKADEANNCGKPLGNLFQKMQSIRVGNNTVPPVITAHSDITVQLTSPAAGQVVTYTNPAATDHYFNLIPVSCTPASGYFFPVGNTTVTCTASDSWGNTAIPSLFNVSVLLPAPPPDTQAPVIAPHADVTVVTTNASGEAVTYATPTATDNVDATVVVSCTPPSGSTFVVGTTTVTCNAQDAATNPAVPTSFKVIVSLETVSAGDQTAPVIAEHADVSISTTIATATTTTAVSYALPTATDNVDPTVAVSCTPASGSAFAPGTTTVTCTAQDAAGNVAESSFDVGITALYTMASQPDESYFCDITWRLCFMSDPNYETSSVTIDLGAGSVMGTGALQTVTIARDENNPNTPFFLWLISLKCFTDSGYTTPCTDWVAPTSANDNRTDSIKAFAATTDYGKHWTASFTDHARVQNFDGTSPVTFNPSYYYQLVIDDLNNDTGAYGSESLGEPYWVITGITQ